MVCDVWYFIVTCTYGVCLVLLTCMLFVDMYDACFEFVDIYV